MMTASNTFYFIATVSLLLSSTSAFGIPVRLGITNTGASLSSSSSSPSSFVRQRPGGHSSRRSPLISLESSFDYNDDDDEDDDAEGYEIRGGGDNRKRPDTTFGAKNVPVDFRPSNEYLNLIKQPTFSWASQDVGDVGLILRLVAIYAAFFVSVCYPISGATWVNDGYTLQKVTASNVGAISVVFVLVLRLYSGWGYIGSRLQSKVIEYEESGWYDGDIEEKSDVEKARDLFLYRSNVKPVEERLRKFSLGIGSAWLASCVVLNFTTSMNPIFNQYDPQMLEKLAYDDKIAGVVQSESNGRPTYCESRYYRAVAGGAPGCK